MNTFLSDIRNKLIPLMVRQAHHERNQASHLAQNQQVTVRPELVPQGLPLVVEGL
jgi:hypothetical protein